MAQVPDEANTEGSAGEAAATDAGSTDDAVLQQANQTASGASAEADAAAQTAATGEEEAKPVGSQAEDPELRKARNEAAERRIALQRYEVFDKYDPEAQDAWLGLIADALENPLDAHSKLQEIADALKQENSDLFEDKNRPLTLADIEQMKRQEQEERDIQQVYEQVKSIKDPVTGEALAPESPKAVYAMLLARDNDGDFQKVAEILEKEKQAIIDNYVQGKYADAKGTPRAPAASGAAPANENAPKTLPEARRAALAYLNQKQPQ